MVFPNKYMHTPIKSEATTKYASGTNEVFESNYGKKLSQASREKEEPLQVDFERLKKFQPTSCDCEVTDQEVDQTALEIKRREELKVFEERALYEQISAKPPIEDRKEAILYGDEYTPLHFDKDVRAHDSRIDDFYRQEINNGSIKQTEISDNISEPILKKKRQVSFNFENNIKSQLDISQSQQVQKRNSRERQVRSSWEISRQETNDVVNMSHGTYMLAQENRERYLANQNTFVKPSLPNQRGEKKRSQSREPPQDIKQNKSRTTPISYVNTEQDKNLIKNNQEININNQSIQSSFSCKPPLGLGARTINGYSRQYYGQQNQDLIANGPISNSIDGHQNNQSTIQPYVIEKSLQPQVLALDSNESVDLDNKIRRMQIERVGGREAMNNQFIKNLKNVQSRVNTFQDKPQRRESIKRYQRMQATDVSSANSQNLTHAQREHQKKLLNQQQNDSRRSSLNQTENKQRHHQRKNSQMSARSTTQNRLRELTVVSRTSNNQRDIQGTFERQQMRDKFDPSDRQQRLQELHQRIIERQKRIDLRKQASNSSFKSNRSLKNDSRLEQQNQIHDQSKLNKTNVSDRIKKIYTATNHGQLSDRVGGINTNEYFNRRFMRYKSTQQSPRRNRSAKIAGHHETYHNLRPERMRQIVRSSDKYNHDRSLIHSQDQKSRRRQELNNSSRSRSGKPNNFTQGSNKKKSLQRRGGDDNLSYGRNQFEQTQISQKSAKSSRSRLKDLESRYQMYNDIRSLKKQLSGGFKILQNMKSVNRSTSKNRKGQSSSRSISQSALMTRDTPLSKKVNKKSMMKKKSRSRSRSNKQYDVIGKKPPIKKVVYKPKLPTSRHYGQTSSFNHDLKSVKSRASKAAFGQSIALNRQSYTNQYLRNNSSRFPSNQRSVKGKNSQNMTKIHSNRSLQVADSDLNQNRQKQTKKKSKVYTHVRSASKGMKNQTNGKKVKIQAKIPRPKQFENEQVSRDQISYDYSPQNKREHEINSSMRNPSMLNSGGTTNDMYSPLAEFKNNQRKLENLAADSELRSINQNESQHVELETAQNVYYQRRNNYDNNQHESSQIRSQPISSSHNSDDKNYYDRKHSLDSHSSYGGRRTQAALRNRTGNSVDRPKKDSVWKGASRERRVSGSKVTQDGYGTGGNLKIQHRRDQFSQRSNGSRKSYGRIDKNESGNNRSKDRSRQEMKFDKGLEASAEIRADQVQILDNIRPMSMDSNAFGSNNVPSESFENKQPKGVTPITHDAEYQRTTAKNQHKFNKLSFGLENFQSKYSNQTTDIENFDSGSFPLKNLDQRPQNKNKGTVIDDNSAYFNQDRMIDHGYQKDRFNGKSSEQYKLQNGRKRPTSGEKSSGRNKARSQSRSRSSQKRRSKNNQGRDKKNTISSSNNITIEDVSSSIAVYKNNQQTSHPQPHHYSENDLGPESVREIYSQLKQKSGQLNSLLDQLSKLVGA